ncbi:MAG: RNA polymerase sigma factor [Candidatus Muiribacteriota bacterium]
MFFEEIYIEYEEMLKRFALSLSRDENIAEDLLQETFMRALKNIELLNTLADYKIKSWLFTVLKNCFYDMKRKNKKESFAHDFDFSINVDFDSKINIENILSILPENIKKLFEYKYVFGMNSKEIAKKEKIPPGTVRYRLHQGVKILKNYVDK